MQRAMARRATSLLTAMEKLQRATKATREGLGSGVRGLVSGRKRHLNLHSAGFTRIPKDIWTPWGHGERGGAPG